MRKKKNGAMSQHALVELSLIAILEVHVCLLSWDVSRCRRFFSYRWDIILLHPLGF